MQLCECPPCRAAGLAYLCDNGKEGRRLCMACAKTCRQIGRSRHETRRHLVRGRRAPPMCGKSPPSHTSSYTWYWWRTQAGKRGRADAEERGANKVVMQYSPSLSVGPSPPFTPGHSTEGEKRRGRRGKLHGAYLPHGLATCRLRGAGESMDSSTATSCTAPTTSSHGDGPVGRASRPMGPPTSATPSTRHASHGLEVRGPRLGRVAPQGRQAPR